MTKVLIIGATGYIGQALAGSLLRAGHTVYGLARSDAKAKQLAAQEVIPVLGSATDSAAYLALIRSAHIDVVVDASGAGPDSAQVLTDLRKLGAERIARAKELGAPAPAKLGFVYTSGTWVHGATKVGERVNDLDPVGIADATAQPPDLVKWRVDVERDVLEARDDLDTAIVRPGLVYGGNGWIWDMYFARLDEGAKNGAEEVALPADARAVIGLVHVDDVGSGLRGVVERVGLGGVHPVFDLVASVESMRGVLEGAAEALGFNGRIKYDGPGDHPFAKAMSTGVNTSSGRAKSILGWQPQRRGMLADIELYVRAWRGSKA